MTQAWLTSRISRHPALARLYYELVQAPLEPILHPSLWRLRLLGLALASGQPLFGWIWSRWLVQPYENFWLRAFMCALGVVFMLRRVSGDPSGKLTQRLALVIMWFELPFFFFWMYLCNGGNAVWLSSLCAMIMIYYNLTDWRIATAGLISGIVGTVVLYAELVPGAGFAGQLNAANLLTIAFCWSCAMMISLSSANLRREHLAHTLSTMGIMAHELRTPLSTAALLGDAIDIEARHDPASATGLQLAKLANRLHALVRNMNHQIDMHIGNARLLQLPKYEEMVNARQLVTDVVAAYPYRTTRERMCVTALVHQDFSFRSSRTQFTQVLDNLIKNALRSLQAANSQLREGDLRIEVGVLHGRGRITVSDNGVGIAADLLPRIFEPFFSTDSGTGHGLGLAFCRRVVQSARGTIRVKSEFARGAIFTIEVPIA